MDNWENLYNTELFEQKRICGSNCFYFCVKILNYIQNNKIYMMNLKVCKNSKIKQTHKQKTRITCGQSKGCTG